jgi:hypothetical protein
MDGEAEHMQYYHRKTRVIMHEYLKTKNGEKEIQLVAKELDKLRKSEEAGVVEKSVALQQSEEQNRANIYEIFRKFDSDESDAIDRLEFRAMLEELDVRMKEPEFKKLMKVLDPDGDALIDFEAFYKCKVE